MSEAYIGRHPGVPFHLNDDVPSVASYQEYPADRPFINTEYRRDTHKPIDSYPENNRDAVMNALKSLQDKIRQLEIERAQAENNLHNIANETSYYRSGLRGEEPSIMTERTRHALDRSHHSANLSAAEEPVETFQGQENNEIRSKLDSAESRCGVLERQLECMRRMVQTAERDRSQAVRKTALLQQQQADVHEEDLRSHLQKINALEREHLKLTATQNLAESKIQELEEKLREEKQHRRHMQEKAAQMATVAETNRILHDANKPTIGKKVKKKRKVVKSTGNSGKLVRKKGTEPPEHYRLNLGDIPFIAGQSTSPSHSIAANFQEVLSLMKNHNSKLCKSPRQHSRNNLRLLAAKNGTSSSSGIGTDTGATESELNDLLLQLQDEFGHMSFEHQELSRQIQHCTDARLREDLERELDGLVARMEAKGDQIGRLRRHQQGLTSLKSLKKKKKSRPTSARATMPSNSSGEIEVTTTIKTRPGSARVNGMTDSRGGITAEKLYNATQGGGKAQASLYLLKDLKKIQTTLRKDDLSWE